MIHSPQIYQVLKENKIHENLIHKHKSFSRECNYLCVLRCRRRLYYYNVEKDSM